MCCMQRGLNVVSLESQTAFHVCKRNLTGTPCCYEGSLQWPLTWAKDEWMDFVPPGPLLLLLRIDTKSLEDALHDISTAFMCGV
jgi:hypothetical protein